MDRQTRFEVKSPSPTRGTRTVALRRTVIENLGRPPHLHKIDVIRLYDDNHYRVNIYCTDKDRVKITDSFFVEVVADGLVSTPPMERKYLEEVIKDQASSNA